MEHLLAPLVEHIEVVDDEAVEETEVNVAHRHLCAELLTESLRHASARVRLYKGDMEQGGDDEI